MKNKTLAIVAYITIIGWIVSYLEFKKRADQSALVNYHLGQSLGLIIFSGIAGVAVSILTAIIPSLYFISYIISALTLVLLLLGVVAANNEAIKPLPLIGKLFEGRFNFTNEVNPKY